MKIVIRIILEFFGVCFLILALVFGIILGLFIDKTNNTYIDTSKKLITEDILNSKITNSLSDFDDNLVCEFDKDELNYFVYSIIKDIPIISGIYIDIKKDESIYFEVPVSLGSLKTCLKGHVKISEIENGFRIKIQSIYAGKISVASGLLKGIVLSSGTINSLNKALEDIGISGKINSSELCLDISRTDLINMVGNLTSNDENKDLFVAICELVLNNENLVKFNFGKENKVGVSVNISSLLYKEEYGKLDYSYEDEFESVKSKVDSHLGNGGNSGNINALYHYYVGGYDSLIVDEKKQIDSLKLSKEEDGIKPIDQKGMGGIFEQVAFPTLIFTKFTVPIKQASFNTIFKGLDFIGKGISFTDGYKSAYILVENLSIYLDEDDKIKMLCVVNLNGTRLCVTLSAQSPEKEGLQIDANVSSLKLGENNVTSVTSSILKWLNYVLANEDWIKCDYENNIISLNFEKYIEENFSLLSTMGDNLNKTIKIDGDNKELEIIFNLI